MSDNNLVVEKIKNKFPDAVVESSFFRDEITIVVNKEFIVDVCEFLRDDKLLRFNYLSDLCGLDKLAINNTYEVVYHLYSLIRNNRLRLKVPISNSDSGEPTISTVTSVWPAANWLEREAYDMFGIVFDKHPDLRRILTADGFQGYPMRKDYPIDKRQPEDLRAVFRKDTD